jgi:Protein of unknown function (DUF2924)
MLGMIELMLHWLASLVKSRGRLEAENLVLRHQLNILCRRASRRLSLSNAERLAFVWLYRLCPSVVGAVAIIRPETVIRWHRQGFRAFWRGKSRSTGGRPAIPEEIRDLINRGEPVRPLATVDRLRPGMSLERGWRGETHIVTILAEGFAYRGQRYRSLSEIARLITGTRWNGPAFFGLRQSNGKASAGSDDAT